MRDSTGTNWLSHFLHGTCAILQLQHPRSLTGQDDLSTQKRTFFLTTRIFEISRSLIYSEPTFLSEPVWLESLKKLWSGTGASLWHPKEALFDMLPRISALSLRSMRFCRASVEMPVDSQLAEAQALAADGLLIQQELVRWWTDTADWAQYAAGKKSDLPNGPDTELLIAHIYYHAISIYLSGTYDYHGHWVEPDAPRAPILSQSQIDWHLHEILRESRELLSYGIAGVFLFFPLRVAGARAQSLYDRQTILSFFSSTAHRGYAVADAFIEDLSDLWSRDTDFAFKAN